MASEQSQRAQTLRYQSNTAYVINKNHPDVADATLPGQLQQTSEAMSSVTPSNNNVWQLPSMGAEPPTVAAVEASRVLQIGSKTFIAKPSPAGYSCPTPPCSQVTAALTQQSPGGVTSLATLHRTSSATGFPSFMKPTSALPPSQLSYAQRFGIPTPLARLPYVADRSSLSERSGSVVLSSVSVFGRPRTGDWSAAAGMPSPDPPRMTCPAAPVHRFRPPRMRSPDNEIQHGPPPTVDFCQRQRFDGNYNIEESELSVRWPNGSPFPPARHREDPPRPPAVWRSIRPPVASMRVFQTDGEFSLTEGIQLPQRRDSASPSLRRMTNKEGMRPPTSEMSRRSIEDYSIYDDGDESRSNICNCPCNTMARRGRGSSVRDADDDLFMIKKSKTKKKKQPPPAASASGFMGFLTGLFGGSSPAPTLSQSESDSSSLSESTSDYELRGLERRKFANLVRKINVKRPSDKLEGEAGKKAKAKEETKEEIKEEKKGGKAAQRG